MKFRHIAGYWIDENDNKWDSYKYNKGEAEKCSKTLLNCRNCVDCESCKYCNDCYNCSSCTSCDSCTDCKYCMDCVHCVDCYSCSKCEHCRESVHSVACTSCYYCRTCKDCVECVTCRYCAKCNNCRLCEGCNDFDKDPQRIVGPIMGSRHDTPTVYWLEAGKEQCVVGCFTGNLNELKEAVKETHKDNPKHLNDYLQWIEKVRKYMED